MLSNIKLLCLFHRKNILNITYLYLPTKIELLMQIKVKYTNFWREVTKFQRLILFQFHPLIKPRYTWRNGERFLFALIKSRTLVGLLPGFLGTGNHDRKGINSKLQYDTPTGLLTTSLEHVASEHFLNTALVKTLQIFYKMYLKENLFVLKVNKA